jgi:hypothetical protein
MNDIRGLSFEIIMWPESSKKPLWSEESLVDIGYPNTKEDVKET